MPRLSLVQTNFTSGEISPQVVGRTDVDRYNNAARAMTNAYPKVFGGSARRPGTLWNSAAKYADRTARTIPFIVSRDIAYMLEFADGFLRIWPKGGGALVAELASPYTLSMLPDIDFAQGADTMFIAHPSVPIQRLRRFSATSFDLSAAPFSTTPFDEQGYAPASGLTLSLATVGTARTATAALPVFLPSDVGREIVSSAGLAVITGYTSTTVVTCDITIAFAGTAILSGAWYLDASPQAIVVPSAKDPVGSSITLIGSLSRAASLTLAAKTGTGIVATASAAVFSAGDVGKQLFADSGVATITAQTATTITLTITTDFASLTYAAGGYGLTDSVWRSGDVGSFVRINGGLAKITAFTSASKVAATIIAAMTSIVASPPLAWSLESSVWNAANGYPRTVTLHEQRLVAAGNTKFPQTIWGSVTGVYLDFTLGTNDDDAYSFTIAADEVNPISYVASLRNMVVHTYGGEFSLQGGVEKPITPTNVRIRPESAHGSKGVRPITVGKESIFVQRAGLKVRAMGYRYDVDGYQAPDLSVLAEHITASGVAGMTYQQEPDSLIWLWRTDGAMLTCTLDRDQSVIGWAKHYTQGAVESMATIPNGDKDEVWLLVRRTVNGATVRYLEILNDSFVPILPGAAYTGYPPAPTAAVYGCTVDCGIVVDNVLGQLAFSVPHLAGCVVDIVADGSVQPQQTVAADGSLYLARKSYRTLIGLHFRSETGLLTPETGTGTGTAQGNSMRTGEITIRFNNTLGATVFDGDDREIGELSFRQFGPGILDKAPELFTGLKRIEKLGWDRGRDELSIVQDQPLPMQVLSVMRKFTVND
jgi:hypothetical protein